MDSNISDKELMRLVKERGLLNVGTRSKKLVKRLVDDISEQVKSNIRQAKSVHFIPQGAKSLLLDIIMSELLRIDSQATYLR